MTDMTSWHGKPYYSLDAYCKNIYHHKCYKIALDAHMTCPNRDGTLGSRGCIFCSAGGSGDFATGLTGESLEEQLEKALGLFHKKKTGSHFIAYFQAYTNTYASLDYLEQIYTQALELPDIIGISIATRPDCLPAEVLDLLTQIRQRYPGKFIWVELGLQTIHQETADYIRRGYQLDCFEQAVKNLHGCSIPVIVHVILGLPGESTEQMYETIRFLNACGIFGIKLQLLHILKNTDLVLPYEQGDFQALSRDAYIQIVIHCLELLSPQTVVHRVTGDGPRELLLAPVWSLDKRSVLNALHKTMKALGTFQGKDCSPS